jgi:hypothetical protein
MSNAFSRRAVVVATTRRIYFGRAVGDDVAGEVELLDVRSLEDDDLTKVVSLAMIGPASGARVGERIDRLVVTNVVMMVDASPRAIENWMAIPSSTGKPGCGLMASAAIVASVAAVRGWWVAAY